MSLPALHWPHAVRCLDRQPDRGRLDRDAHHSIRFGHAPCPCGTHPATTSARRAPQGQNPVPMHNLWHRGSHDDLERSGAGSTAPLHARDGSGRPYRMNESRLCRDELGKTSALAIQFHNAEQHEQHWPQRRSGGVLHSGRTAIPGHESHAFHRFLNGFLRSARSKILSRIRVVGNVVDAVERLHQALPLSTYPQGVGDSGGKLHACNSELPDGGPAPTARQRRRVAVMIPARMKARPSSVNPLCVSPPGTRPT